MQVAALAEGVRVRIRRMPKYRFPPGDADAIVRAAAHHRKEHDRSVIWFSAREHLLIRESIAAPFPRTSNAGLGLFDQLPLEIMQDLLLHLDMRSLFTFRQANTTSRQVVDSLKQYKLVLLHGLNLFCALLRTRLAMETSLLDFYDALCTKACAFCGGFGGVISLLTWQRCCFQCLRDAPAAQVQTIVYARKHFRLKKTEIIHLRSFKTLPGTYTMESSAHGSRVRIVSVHHAGLIATTQLPPINLSSNETLNFAASCALPYYDRTTGKVDNGMSCAGCQLNAPPNSAWAVWNPRTKNKHSRIPRDEIYTRVDFLEHFRSCQLAQLLWRASGGNEAAMKSLGDLSYEALL